MAVAIKTSFSGNAFNALAQIFLASACKPCFHNTSPKCAVLPENPSPDKIVRPTDSNSPDKIVRPTLLPRVIHVLPKPGVTDPVAESARPTSKNGCRDSSPNDSLGKASALAAVVFPRPLYPSRAMIVPTCTESLRRHAVARLATYSNSADDIRRRRCSCSLTQS